MKNVEKTSQPVSEVQDSRMNNICKEKQENVSKKESTAHLATCNPINALDPLQREQGNTCGIIAKYYY